MINGMGEPHISPTAAGKMGMNECIYFIGYMRATSAVQESVSLLLECRGYKYLPITTADTDKFCRLPILIGYLQICPESADILYIKNY